MGMFAQPIQGILLRTQISRQVSNYRGRPHLLRTRAASPSTQRALKHCNTRDHPPEACWIVTNFTRSSLGPKRDPNRHLARTHARSRSHESAVIPNNSRPRRHPQLPEQLLGGFSFSTDVRKLARKENCSNVKYYI